LAEHEDEEEDDDDDGGGGGLKRKSLDFLCQNDVCPHWWPNYYYQLYMCKDINVHV
jgi:hypothetical protein